MWVKYEAQSRCSLIGSHDAGQIRGGTGKPDHGGPHIILGCDPSEQPNPGGKMKPTS